MSKNTLHSSAKNTSSTDLRLVRPVEGYTETPDFYDQQKSKRLAFWAAIVATAVLASALGYSALFSPNSGRPQTTIVPSSEAGKSVSLPDNVQSQIQSGKKKVSFVKVVNPGPRSEVIAIYANGAVVGTLDLSRSDQLVPIVFTPGEVINLKEVVIHAADNSKSTAEWTRPDGSISTIPVVEGASSDWQGVIE